MNKLGFDLMASGWGWAVGVGVLDEIKAVSAQLGLGLGLSLAICFRNKCVRRKCPILNIRVHTWS